MSGRRQGEVMLSVDGSCGEGGGRILRTALALAAMGARGRFPVKVKNNL